MYMYILNKEYGLTSFSDCFPQRPIFLCYKYVFLVILYLTSRKFSITHPCEKVQ